MIMTNTYSWQDEELLCKEECEMCNRLVNPDKDVSCSDRYCPYTELQQDDDVPQPLDFRQ